ncbi:restriction endonuclease subunit S [Leucothrix pacifica]|uniref:Protein HsdA n=1 Tax=Leucothrix pacifica TaxID=1247513 RepID=A0A317CAE1_9GAMM|nr:restriction endonuclease subunit S [Leucothrix pacifica]PWQ95655.1 protein HsdA [Leucothrix pacifica]
MSVDWPLRKLSDVCEFLNSKRIPLKSLDRIKRQGDFPYYGASGIVDHIDDYIFDGTYLLISEDGENLRTRNTPIAFKASGKFWVNNHAHILAEKEDGILDYLEYYFSQLDLSPYITGAVQPKLNKANLDSIEIPIPPIKTRLYINKVLNSFTNKVQLNRQTNQTLEQIAQALFKSWFVDFEPTRAKIAAKQAGQDPERAAMAAISGKAVAELEQLGEAQLAQLKTTAGLFPDALVESELGEVPEGWRHTDLKSITTKIGSGATPRGGKGAYKSEGISQIRSMNVFDGRFVFKDLAKIDNEQASKLKNVVVEESDVLINITGASVTRCCIVPPCVIPARVNQHVCIVRANNTVVCPSYIYLTLTSSSGKATLNSLAQAGATREALTKSHIENFEIILPNEPLMTVFRRKVEHLQDQQFRLTEEVTTLEAIRDALLPKLLSGELSPDTLKLQA